MQQDYRVRLHVMSTFVVKKQPLLPLGLFFCQPQLEKTLNIHHNHFHMLANLSLSLSLSLPSVQER